MPDLSFKGKASQSFVAVREVRDDVIIMKDDSLRAIVMTSSINFALKSAEEQEATIFQFQNFLNSLDFSLEICILSRRLYVDEYLNALREKERQQKNDLLRMQTAEYIQFVQTFVEMQNIMSKYFYLVVPFFPVEEKKASFTDSLFNTFSGGAKKTAAEEKEGSFAVFKEQLWQRVENIVSGLRMFGLKSVVLKEEELMEMLYTLYNPGEEQRSVTIK
jgi:type IV secretory pathway VirB4 component